MYESPITLLTQELARNVARELDETIFKAVFNVVPTVDKDELLKALRYDRGQYDKGYADGKRDAMDELVRCKDCVHVDEDELDGSLWCCRDRNIEVPERHFCSYGERKDGGE